MEHTAPSSLLPGRVWAVTDGHAGNLRQARALAHALVGNAFDSQLLRAQAPWRWVAPRCWPGSRHAFGDHFLPLLDAPPAVAIGCGRQAALATRLLGQRGARSVQILDPRLPTRHWDWVVAPAHDALTGDNVLTVQGSLNEIDDAWLASARQAFPALGALPSPRTAVLIGGPSAHMDFDVAAFEALATHIEQVPPAGLMITASRRTPADVRDALRRRFATRASVLWLDERDGDNPYAGLLAWADHIICTPDSVNMLSEACATRVPVFVFEPQRLGGRPRRFVDDLLRQDRIQPLDTALAPFPVTPLRETARVAAQLRQYLTV